ncbi:MAG: repressor LexA [Deltaproteobacteria bacterium]|nr:repressor LexA [Deltaproteobacteria bacterium]
MDKTLTLRQKEVLEFLEGFIEARGFPPSLREICARLRIKGPKNARKHLEALEKKGFIRRSANISRAIEVIGRAMGGIVSMPIAGSVRAGAPHLAIEDILGHVALDGRLFNCPDGFLLKIEGDSMTGAGIEHGDLVIIRPQNHADTNDIIVAMLDNEATVKRFVRDGARVVLKPENPAIPPIVVGKDREFSIIGKVISVIKRLE